MQQQPFNSTVVCVRDKAVGFFICCLGFSLQHLESRRWWQIFHNALLLAVSSPFIIIVHFPVTLVPICHQALEMVPQFPTLCTTSSQLESQGVMVKNVQSALKIVKKMSHILLRAKRVQFCKTFVAPFKTLQNFANVKIH